jgi:hypothetical protein
MHFEGSEKSFARLAASRFFTVSGTRSDTTSIRSQASTDVVAAGLLPFVERAAGGTAPKQRMTGPTTSN